MATTLYLLDAVADAHLGTDNTNMLGTAVGWTSKALGTARGSGVIASDNVATVTGATAGITITKTSPVEWISPPVAADVTISGTVTLNLWSAETNMNANVAINARIFVIRANATATRNSNTLDTIATTARVTEVAVTTRAANNFTVTPTSTAVNRGDRLRVIVYGDDVGTMATGYTFNISWNGTSAAADGDSYVSFTETITFESAPAAPMEASASTGTVFLGLAGVSEIYAQQFQGGATLTYISAYLTKVGSPPGNVVVEIQTDSADSPTGTVTSTVDTIAASSITTSLDQYVWSGLSIALTPGAKYWLVFRVDAAAPDSSNGVKVSRSAGTIEGFRAKTYVGGSWGGFSLCATVRFEFGPATKVYLTDTASAVSTASVDREAWTSRGAGVQTDVRNTAAGWTAPLQLTDTAGGTVVDWFTRPLTAFTLTGMAVANLRAAASSASGNDSLRCEIARVEGDGTSPTVWASWCIAPTGTDNGELATSEAARTCNVSGDDLAITNGQRLRIRLYSDDMSQAAMATSFTTTVYYAGTSAAASGDTYLTFPQTLTEYASGNTYTKAGYGREAA